MDLTPAVPNVSGANDSGSDNTRRQRRSDALAESSLALFGGMDKRKDHYDDFMHHFQSRFPSEENISKIPRPTGFRDPFVTLDGLRTLGSRRSPGTTGDSDATRTPSAIDGLEAHRSPSTQGAAGPPPGVFRPPGAPVSSDVFRSPDAPAADRYDNRMDHRNVGAVGPRGINFHEKLQNFKEIQARFSQNDRINFPRLSANYGSKGSLQRRSDAEDERRPFPISDKEQKMQQRPSRQNVKEGERRPFPISDNEQNMQQRPSRQSVIESERRPFPKSDNEQNMQQRPSRQNLTEGERRQFTISDNEQHMQGRQSRQNLIVGERRLYPISDNEQKMQQRPSRQNLIEGERRPFPASNNEQQLQTRPSRRDFIEDERRPSQTSYNKQHMEKPLNRRKENELKRPSKVSEDERKTEKRQNRRHRDEDKRRSSQTSDDEQHTEERKSRRHRDEDKRRSSNVSDDEQEMKKRKNRRHRDEDKRRSSNVSDDEQEMKKRKSRRHRDEDKRRSSQDSDDEQQIEKSKIRRHHDEVKRRSSNVSDDEQQKEKRKSRHHLDEVKRRSSQVSDDEQETEKRKSRRHLDEVKRRSSRVSDDEQETEKRISRRHLDEVKRRSSKVSDDEQQTEKRKSRRHLDEVKRRSSEASDEKRISRHNTVSKKRTPSQHSQLCHQFKRTGIYNRSHMYHDLKELRKRRKDEKKMVDAAEAELKRHEHRSARKMETHVSGGHVCSKQQMKERQKVRTAKKAENHKLDISSDEEDIKMPQKGHIVKKVETAKPKNSDDKEKEKKPEKRLTVQKAKKSAPKESSNEDDVKEIQSCPTVIQMQNRSSNKRDDEIDTELLEEHDRPKETKVLYSRLTDNPEHPEMSSSKTDLQEQCLNRATGGFVNTTELQETPQAPYKPKTQYKKKTDGKKKVPELLDAFTPLETFSEFQPTSSNKTPLSYEQFKNDYTKTTKDKFNTITRTYSTALRDSTLNDPSRNSFHEMIERYLKDGFKIRSSKENLNEDEIRWKLFYCQSREFRYIQDELAEDEKDSPRRSQQIDHSQISIPSGSPVEFPIAEVAERFREMGFEAEDFSDKVGPQSNEYSGYSLYYQMRKHKAIPDCLVKIGKWRAYVYKSVLQYSSLYVSGLQLFDEIEFNVKHISHVGFVLAYLWMIQEKPILGRSCLMELFDAGSFLEIPGLTEQIWTIVDTPGLFAEDQAFLLYLEAAPFDIQFVLPMMMSKCKDVFLCMVASREFLGLGAKVLSSFLKGPNLAVHMELEILLAIIRWLCYDWDDRQKHAQLLVEQVHMANIEPHVLCLLTAKVKDGKLQQVIRHPDVLPIVSEALRISMDKQNKKITTPEKETRKIITRDALGTFKDIYTDVHSLHDEFIVMLAKIRKLGPAYLRSLVFNGNTEENRFIKEKN